MLDTPTNNTFILPESVEILIMLLGAFLLGILFAHVTRSRKTQQVLQDSIAVDQNVEDDLQLIEGIGPALEKFLKKNEIRSYSDIIQLDVEGLKNLLGSAGPRYEKYNPTTWPDQAILASSKKWSELEEYQEILLTSKKK